MSQPKIISTIGRAIEAPALRKFKARVLGEVVLPGEERYERARRTWNGMIDPRHPAMIVRCIAPADVVRCVEFARANDLAIAVRAGGHSACGDSFCEGGLVIDVSGMKNVAVDAGSGTARADAGLTVGEFDRATEPLGLATVLGECASVGIAGYTLGGGLGRLMGKHGSGSDNLLSAELVDADCGAFRVSTEENEDLFWAIRGAGANFGIVTSLEYRLHRVGHCLAGSLTYPIADFREVLTFLDDYMMSVPDELDLVIDVGNPDLMTLAPRINRPIVNLSVSYCGDLQKGEEAIRPLRSFCRNIADSIRPMSYFEMQTLSNLLPLTEFVSSGGSIRMESGFIERLAPDLIETIAAFIAEPPPCVWLSIEHYLHGAVCLPAPAQSAFALRRPGYSSRILSAWRDPKQADVSAEWVQRLDCALKPFAAGAMYLNYLTNAAGDAGVRTAYGANYDRLAELKSKYDPTNFFNSNRNIQPAACFK
ncbi:MAG TPA: FAD-binding oxidoreductase [Candidatus Binataceae bacterium]